VVYPVKASIDAETAEATSFAGARTKTLLGGTKGPRDERSTDHAEPWPSLGARLHPLVQDIINRFPPAQLGDVAVFEACKHLAQRVREMSGIDSDDKRLMERAFSLKDPKIRLNALGSATDRAEQQGVMQMASGLWLAVRNPRAHRPAGECDLDETVELLTIVSHLHRRLDAAVSVVNASTS